MYPRLQNILSEATDLDLHRLKKALAEFVESEIEWFDHLKDMAVALKQDKMRLAAAARAPQPVRSKDELINLLKQAGDWKDWYQNNINFLERIFGDNKENLKTFIKILAATSQGASVAANVALALGAFRKMVVDGKTHPQSFKGLKRVRRSLSSVSKGGDPIGPKVGAFGRAMSGDVSAVAVDRHIFEILFDIQSATDGKRQLAFEILSDIAEELGLENRQVQAALWAANQIRKNVTPGNYIEYIDKRRHELRQILDDINDLDVERAMGLFQDQPV